MEKAGIWAWRLSGETGKRNIFTTKAEITDSAGPVREMERQQSRVIYRNFISGELKALVKRLV